MSPSEPTSNASPLSLQRLTAAFAQMLGGPEADQGEPPTPRDACEISPRSIIEAILFVGAADNAPRSAEDLAKRMRDVSPQEVHQAIGELNAQYQADGAPYEIAGGASGYRMQLRPDMARVREKFYGRIKESQLSPRTLEVLSIVAYRQPITAGSVDKLRGVPSRPLLTQLVRRGLLQRTTEGAGGPSYQTTERFLRFFRLESVAQLPRAAELDD